MLVNTNTAPAGPNNGDLTTKFRRLRPYKTDEIKVLLLENVDPVAKKIFEDSGFQVETVNRALSEAELKEKLKHVHALGIRSKTQITHEIIKEAPCLLAIGCFCIGTNQVDCDAALSKGIAVFNSPFSNSRSVAELMICEIIMMARQLGDRNIEMHEGNWKKVSKKCYEIRQKTLGIIGYGHIGAQLSVLAESLGMRVIFYDIAQVMPLGTVQSRPSLHDVLVEADFVTIHVPETSHTINMIGQRELAMMKPGSYLLNASRGTVVDLVALESALASGHIGGAALDVYPEEPEANGPGFLTGLEKYKNVILTPHIGGSTEEAQSLIGAEVATNMTKFITQGCSAGSVNFPEVDLRNMHTPPENHIGCRLLNVHHNVPGVLKKINVTLGDYNIEKQSCESKGLYAYVLTDISAENENDLNEIFETVYQIPESVATRLLY